MLHPRLSDEETIRLGKALYQEQIRPQVETPENIGKLISINVETGEYAIGAFRNLGAAEVEKLTLKFSLKIGGKTGIPMLTEGSAESNFEIQVECKFPPPKIS